MIRTSIIVPFWGHAELLDLWPENLEALRPFNPEVLFVDNGSEEPGRQAIEAFAKAHNLRHIQLPSNHGFAYANNVGAAGAEGDYFIFLNNDVVIKHGGFTSLMASQLSSVCGHGPITSELGTQYVEGWCLGVSKKNFLDIGCWDQYFGPGYWEDVELCYRAHLNQLQIVGVDLDPFLFHIGNTTGCDGRLDQPALHATNRAYMAQKWNLEFPRRIA